MAIPKLEFKEATMLAVAGTCLVIAGHIFNVFFSKMVGYIIATAGLTSMGKRLYEMIKEKAKARG